MKPRHAPLWSSVSLLAAVSGSLAAASAPASEQTGATLHEVILTVSINGDPAGEPLVMLRGADGALYVAQQLLAQWRLRAPPAPALTREGVRYVRLDAIGGVALAIDEAAQSLAVTADPRLLAPTRLAYAVIEPGEEVISGTGAFFNYDLSGEMSAGSTSLGGAVEAGLFTALGVGVSSFVGHWSKGSASLIRLDSNWTIDDPVNMRSLRLGDSISRGGIGGVPLRFGGLQLARNFAVQPGFATIPLPSLSGSAAVPSVVDIYVDNALRDSRNVPPGPFEITGLPIVTGAGDVQLIVRDLLGREMAYSQSYYSAPRMLARGLHDYAFEAGLLRRSFARKSNDYGAVMLSASDRYGFSDNLTGEAHVEASRQVQVAGIGAALAIDGLGLAEFKLAGSRSPRGAGGQLGINLERRSRSFSLGIAAEVASAGYMSVGLGDRRPPTSLISAFTAAPTPFGSIGLSYLRRDGRSERDVEYAGVNASLRLGRLGSVQLVGRKSLKGANDLAADLLFIMPLGNRGSASAGAALLRGRSSVTATTQRNLPVGDGFGYHFTATRGAIDRIDGKVGLNTSFGAHDAQLTWVDGRTGVRLSTSGGIGMVGGELFAARRLDQSFAAVTVGDYPGVRVYADNQLVGRTGRGGKLIVPRLRAFDRNKLSIDPTDLPIDAEITAGERIVRPFGRHGVAVAFAARPARGAIVPIRLDDGSALPEGATVTLAGQAAEWVSAPGGEVYLTGLAADNAGTAAWSAGRCQFRFAFAATDEAQPRLADVACRRTGR